MPTERQHSTKDCQRTPGYRMRPYKTSTAVLHFGVLPGGTMPFWH